MRTLDHFQKLDHWSEIPINGTFIVLTRSDTWLAKRIQDFMRLFQWTRGDRDTDLIPNHADGIRSGIGIGAVALEVKMRPLKAHLSHAASSRFWCIKPIFNREQDRLFWEFLEDQVGEKYAVFDLVKYMFLSAKFKWFGGKEPLNRKKWTCFSLIASAVNYAYDLEVFPDPYKITPFEFCKIVDECKGHLFTNP